MVLGQVIIGCVLFVVVSPNVGSTFSVYQTVEKITADGFQAETHKVTTSDGYILEMHRIPQGRSVTDTLVDRPVVFLMHGILSSSQSFIPLGPEFSFAYNLADAGFDVWMGNARGNKNSRFHTTLDPDDEQQKLQFFDFSFEEIGMYDLPAMIDYVLEFTKRDKLHYIGHSQGGTVFLIMASMLPEYNQKLISVHLLAGVGYQEYFPNAELSQSAAMTDFIYSVAVQMGAVELYPPGSTEMLPDGLFQFPTVSALDLCLGNVQMMYMCQLFGVRHISPKLSNYNAATDQAGAALKQIAHYGQNIRDKLFRRYHHGAEANLAKYGTQEPPLYDLSLITTFVTMHYTLSDNLLDERDVLAMVADIPNAKARQVARTTFQHEDFVAALDAKELVTDYIIEAIQNAGQEDHFTDNDGVIVVDATTAAPSGDTTTGAPSGVSITDAPNDDTTTNAPNDDTTIDAPNDETTIDAPSFDATITPTPDGAATIVTNVYLMVLSLYVMLK